MVLAAAGKLSFIMVGGVLDGKELAMQRLLPSITPDNTIEERYSSDRIWNLAGLGGNLKAVPIRITNSTSSIEEMFGGGVQIAPGNVSLAHNGILMVSDVQEYRSAVLQLLRVPLESKSITLSRLGRSVNYPANFQLGMTALPCPCGNYGSKNKICLCSSRALEAYWDKVSSPLLDRVPLKIAYADSTDVKMTPARISKLRDKVSTAIVIQRALGKYIKDMTPEELANADMTSSAREEIELVKAKKDFKDKKKGFKKDKEEKKED